MANVYIEARPKGGPQGSPSTIMLSKTMWTMCWAPSKHNEKRSIGQKETATLLLLLACGT